MKKKLFYLSFFLLLLVGFNYLLPTKNNESKEKSIILSSTVMIDNLVKEIVEDHFSTTLLIEGEVDPHSYQMRKGDREKIEDAHIIFANGLSLEHNPSLVYLLKSKETNFLGDHLLKTDPELIITCNKEIDPHIWMDLHIMQKVVDEICIAVCSYDSVHEDIYKENTAKLKMRMEVLDKKILALIASIPEEKRYLVSSHDAFNYFVKRYFKASETKRLFSIQGLSPESEVSLKRLNQVINFIKAHDIPVVFFESNLPKDAIFKVEEICCALDVKVQLSDAPLYGDTLGGMGYLEMLEYNAEVIARNLKRGGISGR